MEFRGKSESGDEGFYCVQPRPLQTSARLPDCKAAQDGLHEEHACVGFEHRHNSLSELPERR